MLNKEIIDKFRKVFDGYEFAYGQHGDFKEAASGKMNGRAQTIMNNLPDEIISKHLDGTGSSLGIVPLKANNKVKFGAIDVDIKHPTNPLIHTLEQIEDKVSKLELPLVVCQSKSKGIHLYCFTQEEIDAKSMVDKLKQWASLIGYGSCEIFPKQTHRLDEKDIGNWINLPYFDYKNTSRFSINKGKQLDLEEFFDFVEVMRISTNEIENFNITERLDDNYNDAPPCLQVLTSVGVEEGSRNNGLYNFAVFFRNKYPDNYEEKVMEINGKLFTPPLGLKEVEGIIKAVQKKEFFYKCNEYPICQFCNKTECLKRKFGVGNHFSGDLDFENLTKYISSDNSVRWYAEYQGQRIQLETDDLLNQKCLQKKMLNATNKIFQQLKPQQWLEKIDNLLKTCVVYEDPIDASPKGQFKELLDQFLTDSVPGRAKKDLLKYNTYLDEDENIIYFKSSTLFNYLKNKRFNYDEQEIWHWIKEFGGQSKQIKVSNKKIRVWFLSAPEFYKEEDDIV